MSLLDIEIITPAALVARTAQLRKEGYRLVQVGAARLPGGLELTYSFDVQNRAKHLRLQLASEKAAVPSITSVYWAAFLYENELHDLFNVQVDGIAVDFHGTLYQTAIKFPFGSTKAPVAKPAPGPTAPTLPWSPLPNSPQRD